jgi:hypothetical protein
VSRNRLLRTRGAAVAMIASVVLVAGCGEDAERAGDAVQEGARDVGTAAQEGAREVGTAARDGVERARTQVDELTERMGTSEVRVARVANVTAVEGQRFEPREIRERSGRITLRMRNDSGIRQAIAIEAPERVTGRVVGRGEVSEVTADFPPGRYEFYSPLRDARDAGMSGTLIVVE